MSTLSPRLLPGFVLSITRVNRTKETLPVSLINLWPEYQLSRTCNPTVAKYDPATAKIHITTVTSLV